MRLVRAAFDRRRTHTRTLVCTDFKKYLEEQKAKAKGKRKKNQVTVKTAGFDLSDYRKPRMCAIAPTRARARVTAWCVVCAGPEHEQERDKLDYKEKRTFTSSSRDRRAVGGFGDDDDDVNSRRKRRKKKPVAPTDEELDLDAAAEVDETQFSSDADDDPLAARKHLTIDDDDAEQFDDDDEFFDRTRTAAGAAMTTSSKQAPLTYETLAARREGLSDEIARVRDEITWYEVNVLVR
jgi:hypothetical protein